MMKIGDKSQVTHVELFVDTWYKAKTKVKIRNLSFF